MTCYDPQLALPSCSQLLQQVAKALLGHFFGHILTICCHPVEVCWFVTPINFIYIYIYIHIYIYICICIYCIYMYIYICICIYICIYIYIIHVYIYKHVYIYTYVYIYKRVYIYIVYILVYTYIRVPYALVCGARKQLSSPGEPSCRRQWNRSDFGT